MICFNQLILFLIKIFYLVKNKNFFNCFIFTLPINNYLILPIYDNKKNFNLKILIFINLFNYILCSIVIKYLHILRELELL